MVYARLLLTTSGTIWTPYNWINKFYNLYMAAVVSVNGRRRLTTEAHYKLLFSLKSCLKQLYKQALQKLYCM